MKRLRILLNGPFAGPHAGFALAERRGYLADAGISIDWHAGKGASAVIPELLGGGYDAAYGDLNALALALGGLPPETGPKAIYAAFNQTPLTIAVRAGDGIAAPRDLEGRTVLGHTYDAAFQMVPALVVAAGIDAARVKLIFSEESLGLMVRQMVETRDCDGVFGFVNTIKASLSEEGLSIEDKVGFIEYRDWLPSFYGNSLLASPVLLADAGLARAGRGGREGLRRSARRSGSRDRCRDGDAAPARPRDQPAPPQRHARHRDEPCRAGGRARR